MTIFDSVKKIESVIKSCKTIEQINVADKLCNQFLKTLKSDESRSNAKMFFTMCLDSKTQEIKNVDKNSIIEWKLI